MSNKDRFEVEGIVEDILPGGKFIVRLENGHKCTCTLSGKVRVNSIKILRGDKVIIDISVNDPKFEHGRIIWRDK